MPRKIRPKVLLEEIAEVLNVAALRIRLEIPTRRKARNTALKELIAARDALESEINRLKHPR